MFFDSKHMKLATSMVTVAQVPNQKKKDDYKPLYDAFFLLDQY